MARCNKCTEIENWQGKKVDNDEMKIKIKIISNHPTLKKFSSGEDSFHSFATHYYCSECKSVFELKSIVDMHDDTGYNDEFFFKWLGEINDVEDNSYVIKRLKQYLEFEKWKEVKLGELQENEKITVYQFRTAAYRFMTSDYITTKDNELARIKRIGHKSDDKYRTYLSLEEFYKEWRYGPQFAYKAELLEFEVFAKNIRIENGKIAEYVGHQTNVYVVEDVEPENIYVVNPMRNERVSLPSYEFSMKDKKAEFEWYEQKHRQTKESE